MPCGIHKCIRLCHFGSCGPCIQMTKKKCRCGQKERLILCHQEFFCESRCPRMRQCGRHQCRRKVTFLIALSLNLDECSSAAMVTVHHVSVHVARLSHVRLTNVRLLVIPVSAGSKIFVVHATSFIRSVLSMCIDGVSIMCLWGN